MTNSELRRMNKLRQVMRLSARGYGMAASLVETFRSSRVTAETETVRGILLGKPIESAAKNMVSRRGHGDELLLYLLEQAKVNAAEASKRADKLAVLFEHWVRAKQDRLVEQRIMETRSLIVSIILGGVTAMAASLAPALSNFQLTFSQPQATSWYLEYLGLLFVVPAASFLGAFFSLRRAALNVTVSCLAYLLVVSFFAPLVLTV